MFGIPGLDAGGLVHATIGVAALLLGLPVLLLRKGTAVHRRLGLLYVLSMVLLNVTALSIYDLFGRFGIFHWLAILSLATVSAGVLHVWLRWPARSWMELHAQLMSWSYAGLVAAFFAEIGARVPGVGFATGVIVPTIAVTAIAAVLIHRGVPRIIKERRQAVPGDRGRLRVEQP